MLSGYRVFSRRFVKSFPALSAGFEIETELTVHALELGMPVGEVPTRYKERPAGSLSKLRTWTDGAAHPAHHRRCWCTRNGRCSCSPGRGSRCCCSGSSSACRWWWSSARPAWCRGCRRAVLATGFVLLSFLSFSGGMILDSVTRGRKEMQRLAYLAMPASPRAPY